MSPRARPKTRNALAFALLLTGCAAFARDRAIPIRGATSGHVCHAIRQDRFVGRPDTSEVGADILRATGAGVIRWAPMGVMLTMDYRADRVTVRLGPDRKVLHVSCG